MAAAWSTAKHYAVAIIACFSRGTEPSRAITHLASDMAMWATIVAGVAAYGSRYPGRGVQQVVCDTRESPNMPALDNARLNLTAADDMAVGSRTGI